MDHSAHDHAHHMGHEGHEGHGDHDGHNPDSGETDNGGSGGGGNGGGHGGGHGGHMMMMVFHFGYKEVILFDQWSIDSIGGLIASMLVIAAAAACYEGLKYYREFLFWKTYNSLQYRSVSLPDKAAVVNNSNEDTTRVKPKMISSMHIFQTFLHILQVTLSFLLMLVFMTYNVWLCMGVVIGAAIGYFLFGWRKSVIVDITEHCH